MAIRIGIIGLGKITEDQHIPVIGKNAGFRARRGVEPARDQGRRRADLPDAGGDVCCRARSRRGRGLHAAAGPSRLCARGARRGQACDARKTADGDDHRARRPRRLRGGEEAGADDHLAFAIQRRRGADARAVAGRHGQAHGGQLEGGRPALASGTEMDLDGGRLRRVRSGHQRAVDRHRDPPRAGLRAQGRA